MQTEINYKDLIDLGFNVQDLDDRVFYAIYGHYPKSVTYHLTKKIYINWDCETRKCSLVRLKKESNGDIAADMPLRDLDEVKRFINFYKKEGKQEDETFVPSGEICNLKGDKLTSFCFIDQGTIVTGI